MSDPCLLLIETSTVACSVAISKGQKILASKSVNEEKAHARVIAPMTMSLITETGIEISEIDAVVVSEGPGSYTGLRVGVSLAKGICYGAGKPLISVSSLELLSRLAVEKYRDISIAEGDQETVAHIVPMIDARRMEVYSMICDKEGIPESAAEAKVLDIDSFSDLLSEGRVIFTGDGSFKFKELTKNSNAFFLEIISDASGMLKPALEKFRKGKFEDVAYFEPFYLKEFVAGVSKKRMF